MNDKLTLEELGRLLAECRQMEEAEAEAFVRAFLALVKESLARDKYVRIKGFGTFKLIEGGSCAAESAEWAGTSISFVPDVPLRDAVNKPFAQFESVLLKEGVRFDDVPEVVDHVRKEEEAEQEIRDAADRPILRAAIASGVDVLLTGDKDFLESGIKQPKIITAAEFLAMK